jgi:hypothetical protein
VRGAACAWSADAHGVNHRDLPHLSGAGIGQLHQLRQARPDAKALPAGEAPHHIPPFLDGNDQILHPPAHLTMTTQLRQIVDHLTTQRHSPAVRAGDYVSVGRAAYGRFCARFRSTRNKR